MPGTVPGWRDAKTDRTDRRRHQQSQIPPECEEGGKAEETQACGLDAMEGGHAIAWDRDAGRGELVGMRSPWACLQVEMSPGKLTT